MAESKESNGQNGVWKVIAVALLAALLSGGSALVLNATRVRSMEERIAIEETKSTALERQLVRIENKVDQLLARETVR